MISPCFVVDEVQLRKNLALIKKVSKQSGAEILLALKAFSAWKLFPIIREYVSNATASSLNEAILCLDEMNTKAHTYCVAFEEISFDRIVKISSHIIFNSLSQYHQYIHRVPREVSVGLRINPEWSDVSIEKYNPSSADARLGILAQHLQKLPDRIEGLHFHVLCESSAESLVQALAAFEKKFGHFLPSLKWVNCGGGHAITKSSYKIDLLVETLKEFKAKYQVQMILEPGSTHLWQTGDLYTKILDIVDGSTKSTLIFDASFNCHMPDCLEMSYRPEIVGASTSETKQGFPYRLGGVSCLAGDFLETYWFDNKPKIGDVLIFKDMIHYTLVKTTHFNGIKHPALALRKSNGQLELLRAFDYQDYKLRLS